MMTNIDNLEELIAMALREDVGDGDHSTLACIPSTAIGKAKMVAKKPGILCGAEVGKKVFELVDPSLKVELLKNDGDALEVGDIVMRVSGPSGSILTAERTALNFMQRLSGIATQTNKMVRMLDGLHTRLLDTRKTTPGMRMLEKEAENISVSAVYRNLSELEAEGKLHKFSHPGVRDAFYQYTASDSCREKLHLSCEKCGRTFHASETGSSALLALLAKCDDFSVDKSTTILYGLCKACRSIN